MKPGCVSPKIVGRITAILNQHNHEVTNELMSHVIL